MSEQSYEEPYIFDPKGIYFCNGCGEKFKPLQDGSETHLCGPCVVEQEETRLSIKLKEP